MKKIKKLFMFVFMVALVFTSMMRVNAALPATATFTSSDTLPSSNKFTKAGTTIKKAKIKNSKGEDVEIWALCFNHEKEAPDTSGNGSILYLVNNSTGTITVNGKSQSVLSDGQIKSLAEKKTAYVYILDHGIQTDGSWDDSIFSGIKFKSQQIDKNIKYYATQLALWGVLYPYDNENGVNFDILKTGQDGSDVNKNAFLSDVLEAAKVLRSKALESKYTEPSISINQSKDMYVTADGKYFRTDDFVLSGNGVKYGLVSLTNAPAGAEIVSNGKVVPQGSKFDLGQKFYVRIPYSNVKSTVSGTVSVVGYGQKREVAVYAPVDQNRQNLIIDYATDVDVPASATFKATEEIGGLEVTKVFVNSAQVKAKLNGVKLQLLSEDKKTVIKEWVTDDTNNPMTFNDLKVGASYWIHEVSAPDTDDIKYIKSPDIKVTIEANKTIKKEVVNTDAFSISKQDATTGQELPGAHLVLTSTSTGETIDEWTSGETPHIVVNPKREDGRLLAGNYCLTETIAPEGYQLSTEKVCFDVDKEGRVEKPVVMLNRPKTSVKISKQDITTKKELPGATLVVKDANGNEVDKWVSGTEPHYLQLPDGDYKLIEITAPEGYGISEEVIDFTITNGEAEKTIVMTNEPIPVTADMNLTVIIIGLVATVLLVGFSLFKLNKQQEA